MPALRLSIALDPALLMAPATRGLFPLATPTSTQPWPTSDAWPVLRQGGLRDDLHRIAAAANVPGWFDPPVCLVAEMAARWRVPGLRRCGSAATRRRRAHGPAHRRRRAAAG